MSINEKICVPDKIKAELNAAISEAIARYKRDFEIKESLFPRKRILTVESLIKLLLSMEGGSLKKELHEAGIDVTASAFVQRRSQLSSVVMEQVLECFNRRCRDEKTYKGYRVLAVDGTTVNMARNEKAPTFVQNESNPRGYNQFHVNPLYDVLNKTYQHCIIQPQPKQDEVGALTFMLTWHDFSERTLIVADRGYESYNLFAHCLEHPQLDFLIRVKQDRSAMREIRKLPMTELDTNVSFTITTTQTNADKENGYILVQTRKNPNRTYSANTKAGRWDFPSPYPMKFRVVRFQLDTGEYETLATSLPDSFTFAEIKELYHARWGIETAFRELKYGLGLVNLHGKKDEFVRQEIYAAMIMSNFTSRIAGQVVIEKNSKSVHAYAVNMKMAIYLCKKFYRTPNADGARLMREIAKYAEPVRPGRRDTRNIKAKSFAGFVYRVAA